jgi:hypothetical protein
MLGSGNAKYFNGKTSNGKIIESFLLRRVSGEIAIDSGNFKKNTYNA